MGILLLVVGAIGVASGLLKMRARPRAQGGLSLLTIIETTLAALTVLGSGAGLARAPQLAWTMVFLVSSFVVWSSTVHARRVLAYRRALDDSAEDRFRARFDR